MYTRCPSCQTLFRIQAQQLKVARGQVRCGECQTNFDAIEFLVNRDELSESELQATTTVSDREVRQWHLPFDDEAPLPVFVAPVNEELPATNSSELLSAAQIEMLLTPDSAEQVESEALPPEEEPLLPLVTAATDIATQLPDVAMGTEEPPDAREQSTIHPEELPSPPAAAAPDEESLDAPSRPRYSLPEEEPALPHSRWSRLGWGLASLLMLLLLGGQWTLLNRDTLGKDPSWRPWLEQGCAVLGCTLPLQRDLAAIEMVERSVLSHPDYQRALLITATLINKAPFAQPFPEVELTMTDLEQKPVAQRRFLPREYLSEANPAGLFPAGATVRLRLEIADPGDEAVGFEFDFY